MIHLNMMCSMPLTGNLDGMALYILDNLTARASIMVVALKGQDVNWVGRVVGIENAEHLGWRLTKEFDIPSEQQLDESNGTMADGVRTSWASPSRETMN